MLEANVAEKRASSGRKKCLAGHGGRDGNHLVVNRALARNVRSLEVLDERSTQPIKIPPGILTSDTDLESSDDEFGLHEKQERYLSSALTKMTALSSLTWSCNHSPISIDNIRPTLLKCHSLHAVEINDNLIFSSAPDADANSARRQPLVCRLTSF